MFLFDCPTSAYQSNGQMYSPRAYFKVMNCEPKVVTTFRSELKTYIEEVRTGTLKLSSIDKLLSALEVVKSHKDSSNIIIELSTEELDVLVNRIYEYTKCLAEMNEYHLNAEDLEKYDDSTDNLYSYLTVQKQIFETAA